MAFGVYSNFDGSASPGVLDDVARQVILGRANDSAQLQQLFAEHDDIAAVIIEPTGASWGQVPVSKEFLRALREVTARAGAVLIFDEVITGFRCSPGGAQAVLGITPDLTTLAKILAGGLPGGAVCGRRDVMELLAFGSPVAQRVGKISHHGTFNANPLSAAAGIATLELVATTDACQRASEYAAQLRAALADVVAAESLPWVVYGTYSGFHIFTNPQRMNVTAAEIESCQLDHTVLKAPTQPGLLAKLRVGMLVQGVEIFSWPGGPTSAVHGPAELECTVEAFRRTVRALKDEGDIA
jgi:glutamate-1-semialdehyde 2,1-aminomutase